MTLSACRSRNNASGHHWPDAILALTHPCTVDRWQAKRRASSFLVNTSNSTHDTTSMCVVSSKTMLPVVCVERRVSVPPPRCCRKTQSRLSTRYWLG